MTLRRIQLSSMVAVLFTLFLSSGLAQPTDPRAAVPKAAAAKAANWTFLGCWTQFSAGPCRDVYRDQQGNHWVCRACGTTGNPGPGKCNPISEGTLATGLWCS